MNVLIIGSGGRENAIAWKLAQSPRLAKLYIAPGNPGTAALGENVHLKVDDHAAITAFCREAGVDLVVVGPEAPLAAGLADHLVKDEIRVFGPRKAAAQIEASKAFAKQFMGRHNIPTARFATFHDFDAAVKFLDMVDFPVVIKASGLAAGKGVILPENREEAIRTLEGMLVKHEFGAAGREIVIEERLTGQEVSLMAFTDGKTIRAMPPAQDYKRLLDGDRGPNTGGMGAYAPAPICPPEKVKQIAETILLPAISGLRHEGTRFVGVLFAGLMLAPDGPKVLEFNCRFGDPETQAVLPLLETDLLDVLEACVDGHLRDVDVKWKKVSAACVVLASEGYPGRLVYGKLTKGSRQEIEHGVCFHAGTRLEGGKIVTAGGRVFGVTSWADSVEQAVERVYASVEKISFEGMQYRRDIAWQALQADAGTDEEADKLVKDATKLVEIPSPTGAAIRLPAPAVGRVSASKSAPASVLPGESDQLPASNSAGVTSHAANWEGVGPSSLSLRYGMNPNQS
ncbi:MAG: phosphoribosylamine--glycine ligase, partial [Chloroflexi bacterium]